MIKRLAAMLSPLVLAGGMLIAFPGTSQAATDCAGLTHISYAERFNDSKGVPMATLYIYNKTSAVMSDEPACAILYSEGAYYGQAKYMSITICDNYTGDPCVTNRGTFKDFAGPVVQKRGGCSTVTYEMKNSKGVVIVKGSAGDPCD
ncbi:hypothetical protein P3T36_000076 [Kitasatospora sp. MAP12-15]|uniref:hypothetical protein n=1 Tax=unclassified Kitasatospora TaxID=2633591 RepID=UPI0024741E23|nr:hypothetical protein [Kitasatospora sp. MAP12-44]MDH6109304.1 hypothetical protein [Kitasatospora sp. MAP12-44]